MAKMKVIVDYSQNRYSDNDLATKGAAVGAALTDNTNYPTLKDVAVTILGTTTKFRELIAKMLDGNKQVTIEKNQVRTQLETLLSDTALKVQDISGGDELLIANAGFDVKRKPTPVGALEMPTGVTAKAGPSRGTLEISWNVVPGTYLYEIRYTESPVSATSLWKQTSTTKHKIVLEGLVRGQAYAISVAAAAADPSRNWSDDIISYVM